MIEDIRKLLVTMGALGQRKLASGMERDDVLKMLAIAVQSTDERSEMLRLLGVYGPSFSMAWAENGFPCLEPSQVLAASMMATTVSKDAVQDLELPWRCFGAIVPAGTIENTPILMLFLRRYYDGLFAMWTIHNAHVSFSMEKSLAEYADLKFSNNFDANIQSLSEIEVRKSTLLGRFIVGLCIEMEGKSAVRPIQRKGYTRRAQRDPKPTAWIYRLARPINVDVREAIRNYADGVSNKKLNVQCLVAGHYKLQPYGDGRLLRKRIHVEPYWRGPEDAPIAVRSHKL